MEVTYQQTDENLQGIVQGLSPEPQDRILSICGSGDQPFALLENAGYVLAIDHCYNQIQFAIKRKEKLQEQDTASFVGLVKGAKKSPQPKQQHYYFNQDRLEKIRQNLKHIEFKEATIHQITTNETWSKIYLSNISMAKENNPFFHWNQVALLLNLGGLVYHASIYQTNHSPNTGQDNQHLWPKNLILDQEQTQLSQKCKGYYNPAIFRKI